MRGKIDTDPNTQVSVQHGYRQKNGGKRGRWEGARGEKKVSRRIKVEGQGQCISSDVFWVLIDMNWSCCWYWYSCHTVVAADGVLVVGADTYLAYPC